MADEIDAANDMILTNTAFAIKQASSKVNKLEPIGECYNCLELVTDNKAFCDVHCRDDYEKRKRASSIIGRV